MRKKEGRHLRAQLEEEVSKVMEIVLKLIDHQMLQKKNHMKNKENSCSIYLIQLTMINLKTSNLVITYIKKFLKILICQEVQISFHMAQKMMMLKKTNSNLHNSSLSHYKVNELSQET